MERPSIVLGVAVMDEDHEALESLLGRVEDTPDTGLGDLFGEVEAEMKAHFGREEDIMRLHNVPVLTCHMALHEFLLAQLARRRQALANGDTTLLRHFMTNEIPQMLADHINSADRVTANFIGSSDAGKVHSPNPAAG